MITAMAQIPVPRDLELPLPIPREDLKIILVLVFLAHILFVNLMVGGSLLTVFFEILGLSSKKFDSLAKRIAQTITVNKSLAVVLGVGPLLCISLVYTTHFYSANALTGYAWISVVPLVTLAFLLTYLHKYTWDKWVGSAKRMHVFVGLSTVILFVSVPLIFLTNINLMLFPDSWQEIKGFFSSLRVGNVFPRWFHFLSASLAITGLFLSWWLGRKAYPVEQVLEGFTRPYLRRLFLRVAFYVSLAQLLFGPLVLFTLPAAGITSGLLIWLSVGIIFVVTFLYVLNSEINRDDNAIGRKFHWVIAILTLVVLIMGTVRHTYREASLAPHRQMISDRTDTYHSIELATMMRIEAGLGAGDAIGGGPTGEKIFINCAACHAVDRVLAAPSLIDVYSVYKENPDGIVQWAKEPGRKRLEFAPMPSFKHLGDEQLLLVAKYILEQGAPVENTADTSTSSN